MATFPLQVVISAIDRLTAPIKKTQERVAKALDPLKRFNNSLAGLKEAAGLDRLAGAMGKVRDRIGDATRAARDFVLRLTAIGAIAGGAMLATVRGFAKTGEELVRLSDKLGVGIQALQEWRHAARLNNVEDGQLEAGLAVLARTVGQAAAGVGPARVAFRRLGVELKDADGKIRPLEELFPEIADKLNQLEDPMRRAALQAAIFGRGGADLAGVLKKGSAGLREASEEFRALGLGISDAAARSGDDFTDAWVRLQAVIESVRNTIGAALLPVIQDLVRELQGWLVENRPAIAAFARELAANLPGILRDLRDLIVDVAAAVRPLIEVVQVLADKFGGANVAIAAVALILGGKLLVSIAAVIPALIQVGTVLVTAVIPAFVQAGSIILSSVVPAVVSMVGVLWTAVSAIVTGVIPAIVSMSVAFLTSPFGWVVLGIAAVVAAAVLLWKNWDKVVEFLLGAWRAVRDAFVAAFGWIIDNMPWVLGPVGLLIKHWGRVKEFLSGAWTLIRTGFEAAFGWIVEHVPWVLGPVGLIVKHWGKLKEFFSGLWGGIRDAFGAAVSWISTKVEQLLGILPDWLVDLMRGAARVSPIGLAATAIQAARGETEAAQGQAAVNVRFENAPPGTRVEPAKADGVELDVSMGFAMGGS